MTCPSGLIGPGGFSLRFYLFFIQSLFSIIDFLSLNLRLVAFCSYFHFFFFLFLLISFLTLPFGAFCFNYSVIYLYLLFFHFFFWPFSFLFLRHSNALDLNLNFKAVNLRISYIFALRFKQRVVMFLLSHRFRLLLH